jgi:ditrans,polycis-polyprenyl diphosphate synthase
MLGEDKDGPPVQERSRSISPETKTIDDGHSSATSTVFNASEKGETPPTYLDPETISVETLNNHMLTAGAPPLDLLVRTSGVERLSDFMLWQSHQDTSIVFLKCLWPEFDLWTFLPVLVEWQWQRKKLQEQRRRGGLIIKRD